MSAGSLQKLGIKGDEVSVCICREAALYSVCVPHVHW